MPRLGNLRTATKILTELKQHMRVQTDAAATAAGTRRFAEASQILSTEIVYADQQRKLAQSAREKAKAKAKHADLFTAYTPLERDVTALFNAMTPLKNQYDAAANASKSASAHDARQDIAVAEEPERTMLDSAEHGSIEAEQVAIEIAMKSMGHLRRATTLLTQLKQHIRLQTAAATTAADMNNFAAASKILSATTTYADEQRELARTERSQSKNKPKHAALIIDYPRLENEVAQLYAAMTRLKVRYDESERQRLDAELEHDGHIDEDDRPASRSKLTPRGTGVRTLATTFKNPDEDDIYEESNNEEDIEQDEEHHYENALIKLSELKTKKLHEDLERPLDELIAHIKKLKKDGKEPTSELIEALTKTHLRLTDKLSSERYKEYANTVQGKSSVGLKILGGLMVALGIAAIVAGAALLPAAAGIAIGFTGLLLGAGGIGLFAINRQKGLAKAIYNINEAKLNISDEEVHPQTAAPTA